LDSLKPEPTQNFGKAFQEIFKDIAFVSHLIDKKKKSDVLIVAEHKSKPEPFVLLQLLVYLVLTWYKRWQDAGRPQSTKRFRLPVPILVVLYNGKEDWKGELDLKDLVESVPAELEQVIPKVKVFFIRLNKFDKRRLPGKPRTRAVVESMIRATGGTFVAGLGHIVGYFAGSPLDKPIGELLEDIFGYCAWTEGVTPDTVDKAILNVIKGQEGIKMTRTIKKGLLAMGYKSGFAEGESRGRAGSVIRVLTRRFRTVSKPVKDKVGSITDTDRLDELMDRAVDCPTLDEFTKALDQG
jgi:hypothetical protein